MRKSAAMESHNIDNGATTSEDGNDKQTDVANVSTADVL